MWGKRRLLDPEVEEWHIECWAWLMRHLGGVDALRETRLVLPTAEFFPKPQGEGHAAAESVFSRVQSLMGLEEWPCTLVERHSTNAQVGEFLVLQPERGKVTAGTFESDGNAVVISYDPELLRRPGQLIATFAHELAHYVLHTIPEPPPGADVEPMLEELATELAVAYFGFGVIAANAAFTFEQYQDFGRQGWRGGASGYFSEDGWAFAIAVFLALREESAETARRHLKPDLVRKLELAERRLSAAPALIQSLRGVTPVGIGG